ncbi:MULTISPECIES: hypothetical protein [unclassified Sphingomonas]|uniref:hypothetical protein n=1 Tax=unclassified Sphingomonas TaxID=196159 RepID=UPI002269BF85|nr:MULTISPECIES: hypothetical protein [unclassified Sphingomonas]
MSFHYSAANASFYHADIHHALPDDAVPISAREHARLLAGQASGRSIVAAPNGRPTLSRSAAPKLDQLRAGAVRAVKREARRRILAVATIERQSNDNAAIALAAVANLLGIVHDDREVTMAALRRRAAIDAIRAASNRIETTIAKANADDLAALDVMTLPLWPEG